MTTRWEVEGAVYASNIEPTGRHILHALLGKSTAATAEIPPKHAPSFTELERLTGISRSALIEWMKALTDGGWVRRIAFEGESREGIALLVGDPNAARAPRPRANKTTGEARVTARQGEMDPDVSYRQAVYPEAQTVPPGDMDRTAERYDAVPPGGTNDTAPIWKNSPTESSLTSSTLTPPLFAEDADRADPTSTRRARGAKKAEPFREDVERICKHLADQVIANGSKAVVTDTWRKEARLLLDEPRPIPVTVEKVIALIDWCQKDPFWSANVRCMKTFRRQYDGLRLKARNEYRSRADNPGTALATDGTPQVQPSTGTLRWQQAERVAEELERQFPNGANR